MDWRKLSPPYVWTHRERVLPFLRHNFPRLGAALLVGNRHRCFLCGAPLRRFTGFFNAEADDAFRPGLCPFCYSLPRTRQLAWWLTRSRLLLGRPRVLFVAPSPPLLHMLKKHPLDQLTTFDLERTDVDVRGDLQATTFADESFDLIICVHVLEHVPDDKKAFAEFLRLLSPRGTALLMVPLKGAVTDDGPAQTAEERTRRFGQPDHLRQYGDDFLDRVRASGLLADRVDFPDALALPPTAIRKFGMDGADALFVARRPG